MTLLSFALLAAGVTGLAVLAVLAGWALLDGRGARRDARRRNQAHRR